MTGILVLILRIALAVALYSFLGWAFYVLWQDLRQQSALLNRRRIPSLQLTWLEDQEKRTRLYHTPELIIGRDSAAECSITNETISARHARLSFHHNQWWLEDLKSTNGTFLNQERLDIPTVIVSGDELRCGQVNLSVMIHDR
ncbi:MAG: FHA domain-containing protein [Anaerolineaceae bacterium]|nr:FHA domain-containing protein [Anaerolineaceae bacterium]